MSIPSLNAARQLSRTIGVVCVVLFTALAQLSVEAASQIWTNAPVSGEWSTGANWVGGAAPGQATFTTGAQNGDSMTFNSPLFSGIGGVANPFRNSDTNRQVRNIIFETADCGPYVLVSSNGFGFGLSATLNTAPGGVAISAAVTNAQIIDGLTARLQNSQNGAIGFTNASTTATATLTINNLTNTSANTRPLVITLAGSNTGANRIGYINDNAGANGAILIDKIDSGRWILSGANDLPQKTSAGVIARVQVIEGTLVVQDPGALGSISAGNLTVTNTGVLQIDNVTLNNAGMTLRHGGTIRMNGTGGINGLVVNNTALLTASLATTSASDVFTIGGIGVVSGGVADSVLNFNGPGTMVLGTVNTYAGRWSFNSGTNRLTSTSALGTAASVHIAAGAILDTTDPSIGSNFPLTTVAFSAAGTGTTPGSTAATINAGAGGTFNMGSAVIDLTFTPTSFIGDTTHPALYISEGSLALNANQFNINNASGTPLGLGTYRLVQLATGSVAVTGTPFAVVLGAGLAPNTIADIQVTGGFVNLVVSAHIPASLSWRGGNPDSNWDDTTPNWFNGISLVAFENSDAVTFDSPGLVNPNVNVTQTVLPSGVTIDASTNAYTLGGAGRIAGQAGLVKLGTNALVLQTVNAYLNGTTISNGIVRIGIDNAIPNAGSGNVSIYSPAILDLNNFSNSINGLIGSGTIDNTGGGAGTLSVGQNNSSMTFTGVLQNTSGTLALRKLGTGTLTLPRANNHSGGTTVDAGTLRIDNYFGFGGGSVNVNGGILNVTTNVLMAGLFGSGGTVANNSSAQLALITMTASGEYTGVIANGSGGGGIRVYVQTGTTRFNGNCTYGNGTIVASGATLAIGVINPGGSGAAGTGGITASNGANFALPTAVSTSSALPNAITNIDANGTVYFSSASQANNYNGQFYGGASNTNIYSGPLSIGGAVSFSNFPGTVVISNGASVRIFNANAGGDNTIFDVRGNFFSRDPNTIRLGALIGGDDGGIRAPTTAPGTFIIGAKNLSTTFPGTIVESNNIVKTGTGSLTLNGRGYYTNTVTLPDMSVVDYALFTNRVLYTGTTTVSNGTLKVVAPNNLTNSSSITLAGANAILDATTIGYSTNQTTLDINNAEQPTNTFVVTTGTLEIIPGQSLNGSGTIQGNLVADAGSTVNAGLGIGTLTVSGSATINGTLEMQLNRTNSPTADRLAAPSIDVNGAVINVTNLGPDLVTGDTYQLFSVAVTGTPVLNLPTANQAATITYVWTNMLAINGTIKVLSGADPVNPNPTNITASVSGNQLTLRWPASHTGWTLQTNSVGVGSTNSWFPHPSSTGTNQVTITIETTKTNVFYRLRLTQ